MGVKEVENFSPCLNKHKNGHYCKEKGLHCSNGKILTHEQPEAQITQVSPSTWYNVKATQVSVCLLDGCLSPLLLKFRKALVSSVLVPRPAAQKGSMFTVDF
jgi:hypothetical protein